MKKLRELKSLSSTGRFTTVVTDDQQHDPKENNSRAFMGAFDYVDDHQ